MNMEKENKVEAWMFRVRGEFTSLLIGLITIFVIAISLIILGQLFFSALQVVLLLGSFLTVYIFIKLVQAQYLGNSIRVHDEQFPEIFEIFKKQAVRLNSPRVALYIEQDPQLKASTIGIGNAAVVLSSGLVEALSPNELAFVIGHELAHFKAGHTKISSIFGSARGIPYGNFFLNFWGRNAEYSADRCGLILTKDIDSAITTMIKLAVGAKLFEELNLKGYIAQIKKSKNTSVKLSETMGTHPFITNRIINLLKFWRTHFKGTNENAE